MNIGAANYRDFTDWRLWMEVDNNLARMIRHDSKSDVYMHSLFEKVER